MDAARLLGREELLARVATLLGGEEPLAVLHGGPGVGKSAVASAIAATWDGDLVCVSLGGVTDPDGFQAAVATALGGAPGPEAVARALAARRRPLLLLDDAEGVADEVERWAPGWIADAGNAALLVTSRVGMDLGLGSVVRVPPLPVPPLGADTSALRAQPAVELLIQEGRRVDARGLDEEAAVQVLGAVARLLDGVPLALRIAGRHLDVTSPEELLEALRERERLSDPGAGRHAAMEEAVAWSWSMLPEWGRRLLSQVTAFAGAFPLEAAREVLRLPRGSPASGLLEGLRLLQRHGLLELARREGQSWFRLLRPVKEFVLLRGNRADRTAAEARHARWCAGEARRLLDARAGNAAGHPYEGHSVAQVRALAPDFAAVVARAVRARSQAAVERGLWCWCAQATVMHQSRDQSWRSGLPLVERVVGDPALLDALPRALRRETLLLHAYLLTAKDQERARRRLEEVLRRASAEEDALLVGRAGIWLGEMLRRMGRDEEGFERMERALALLRRHPRSWAGDVAGAEAVYGGALRRAGRFAEARRALESSVDRAVAHRLPWLEMQVRARLGALAMDEGRLQEAHRIFERVAERAEQLGNVVYLGTARASLGLLAHADGEPGRALPLYEEGLRLLAEIGDPLEAQFLGYRGLALWDLGELESAREQLALAAARAAQVGWRQQQALWEGCLRALRGEVPGPDRMGSGAQSQELGELLRFLALAASGRDTGKAVGAWLEAQRRPLSIDARLLRRLLGKVRNRAGTRPDASSSAPAVLRWIPARLAFVPPGSAEEVSLASHRTLWRVLDVLVDSHRRDEDGRVSLEEMLRRAWPDERLTVARARNRVYVAINKLRHMGLRTAILRDQRGYFLTPDLVVVVEAVAEPDAR